MSLNQITLTPKLTADLYTDTLIDYSTNRAPYYDIKFLGNNHSNVLIFINNKNESVINKLEMSFLTNVLGACKLTLDDVCLVNLHTIPIENYKRIVNQFHGKVIIMFDVEPVLFGFPVNSSAFQIKNSDDIIFLYAPSLLEIEKEKGLKQKLWSSLKQIFSIQV